MPDQFGNPTPQEVMQGFADQAEAMRRSAQTPQARREANLYNLGRGAVMGMNPQVVRAREIENALKAGSELERGPQETALDFQIRQARQMFDDVKQVDPTTAAQISAQLTQLESERAEQARLQQSHELDVEQAELDIEADRATNILEGRGYLVNIVTGEQLGSLKMNDPLFDQRSQELGLGQPGVVVLPYDEASDFGADELFSDMFNKSTLAEMGTHLEASTDLAATGSELIGVLNAAYDADQNALSDVSSAERVLNRISGNIDELAARCGSEDGQTEPLAAAWLRANASRRNISSALLTKMAYQVALAFNRRVTDKDFELAYSMLGGDSGSPEVAVNTIRANLRTNRRSVDDSIGVSLGTEAFRGTAQGTFIGAKYDKFTERDDEFQSMADAFLEKIEGTAIDATDPRTGQSTSSPFSFVPQQGQQ
jgi:hypothetical protein